MKYFIIYFCFPRMLKPKNMVLNFFQLLHAFSLYFTCTIIKSQLFEQEIVTKFTDFILQKSAFFSSNMAPKREKHLSLS